MADKAPNADALIYVKCMDKVRNRIAAIKWLVATTRFFKSEHYLLPEAIFVQFRKILELIAYSSLSAHREKYAEAYKNFENHWKAKAMLDAVEQLNPEFYPIALLPPTKTGDNSWMFPGYQDGALTRADFEKLYDACGDILHMKNPFSAKNPVTDIGYSVDEWVVRIEKLLTWHSVELLDDGRWLCYMPPDGQGNVHVYPGVAVPPQPDATKGE